MPITVTCPQCHTMLRVPDNAVGRKVKCPKCSAAFEVAGAGGPAAAAVQAPVRASARPAPAEDEYDDRPRRRDYQDEDEYDDEPPRRRARQEHSATGLQTGLGIASLVVGIIGVVIALIPCVGWWGVVVGGIGLVLGVVGIVVAISKDKQAMGFPIAGASVSGAAVAIGAVWLLLIASWFHASRGVLDAARGMQNDMLKAAKEMQDQQLRQRPNPPPNAGGGRVIMQTAGQLVANDPADRVRGQSKCKTYTVNLEAGKTYQIDMTSGEIDSYLRLENAAGQQLAEDDDGGGFPNARILFNCPATGQYRIICTTFIHALGNFNVSVRQL